MPDTSKYELPKNVSALGGKIIDVDMHECVPINHWIEEFGAVAQPMFDAIRKTAMVMVEKDTDDTEINAKTVWQNKLENAPGSFDLSRRLDVMDFTGIDKALVFPGALAMISVSLYASEDRERMLKTLDVPDRRAYAIKLQGGYNDWCARASKVSDRLRPVAILVGEDPDDLYKNAERLVKSGVKCVWTPTGVPPAGVSPADTALDRTWALLAEAKCPVTAHVGGQAGFLASSVWGQTPAFDGWKVGGEFSLDPWSLSVQHLSAQNFIATMILGGVFERHPGLVFGTAEYTGHWVGPLAENLDRWVTIKPFRNTHGKPAFSRKPSEYFATNIRIGCFDFEPVSEYIEKFGFEDVYCYSSDYPHNGGGKDPIGNFSRNLDALGPKILKKVFVDNGHLLLPD